MTLKQAAFWALIGTVLAAAVEVYRLIFTVLNIARGLVPADAVITALIFAFAACTAALFFFVFHRQTS